jgi:putative endonuclease (uncharacterized protein DUF1780)
LTSRPMLTWAQYKRDIVRDLEDSVAFFGAGVDKQRARERIVVGRFLRGLRVRFKASELQHPPCDPPDVVFRVAAFEVKELGSPGRRRHAEYREQLRRAKAASSWADFLVPLSTEELSIATVCKRILVETEALAARKYADAKTRQGLDLLFYVNPDPAKIWRLTDGARPDVSQLARAAWRSVSFLHGISSSCVIHASPHAPKFLRSAIGPRLHAMLNE